MMRRVMRKPRTVAESPNLLPTLIKVFAAFARVEGELLEERSTPVWAFSATTIRTLSIPNCESFSARLSMNIKTRCDRPAAFGKFGRRTKDPLGRPALRFDLKAGLKQEQVIAYYSFMSQLGWLPRRSTLFISSMRTTKTMSVSTIRASPLDVSRFEPPDHCDVLLPGLSGTERILAYR
jgi:hypothetical protein